MDRAVFVYTTFPGLVEAEEVAKVIIERRLAACANIRPGMVSHYWWQRKVERDYLNWLMDETKPA